MTHLVFLPSPPIRLLRSLNSLREDIGVRPRNSGLFVLPAESRLSGSARGLEMVKEAQSCGWKVLLDATGMSCGQDLVFHGCKPEYVAFSFYKVTKNFHVPNACSNSCIPDAALSTCLRYLAMILPALDACWYAGTPCLPPILEFPATVQQDN